MDRTLEFNSCAEYACTKQKHKKKERINGKVSTQFFTQFALQLNSDIVKASNRLTQLNSLVKTIQVLFEDPTQQIEDLVHVIKQDISQFNLHIKNLKEIVQVENFQGQQSVHAKAVIAYLSGKIVQISKDFKSTLDIWTKGIVSRKVKMQRIVGTPTNIASMSLPNSGFRSTSNLPEYKNTAGGQVMVAIPGLPITQEYTASRASSVEQLEGPLNELHEMFTELLSLIARQDDDIKRIDENVNIVSTHIEKGHNELLKYLFEISHNRGLVVKLFGTLIVFVILFVFFIL